MISESLMWWVKWLAQGGVIERSAVSNPTAKNCIKRITWATVYKLEDAGLVYWGDPYKTPKFKISKVKLELTDAGKASIT